MHKPAICPECGGSNLHYDKDNKDVVEGQLLTIVIDDETEAITPVVDREGEAFNESTRDSEHVQCLDCDGFWYSLEEYVLELLDMEEEDPEPTCSACDAECGGHA